jgi:hypothetical protein
MFSSSDVAGDGEPTHRPEMAVVPSVRLGVRRRQEAECDQPPTSSDPRRHARSVHSFVSAVSSGSGSRPRVHGSPSEALVCNWDVHAGVTFRNTPVTNGRQNAAIGIDLLSKQRRYFRFALSALLVASVLVSVASLAANGSTHRNAATSHAVVSPTRSHLVSFAARVEPHHPRLTWHIGQIRAVLIACACATSRALARMRGKVLSVIGWRGSATRRGPPALRDALI